MTTPITQFDKKVLKVFQPKFEKAVTEVIEAFGLTVEFSGGIFESSTFKPKITIIASGADPDKEDFEAYAEMFGLKPDDYGKEFRNNGNTYTLAGLAPNRPKFPIIGERSDGKRFKFTTEIIERAGLRN